MIGNYVKYLGKIAMIMNEYLGEVTIITLHDGVELNLFLSDVTPTSLRSIDLTYGANGNSQKLGKSRNF